MRDSSKRRVVALARETRLGGDHRQGDWRAVERINIVTKGREGHHLRTIMDEFLRTPGFQQAFLTERVRRRLEAPPRRMSEVDQGQKVTIRQHIQDRKKVFDFQSQGLWSTQDWSEWRQWPGT